MFIRENNISSLFPFLGLIFFFTEPVGIFILKLNQRSVTHLVFYQQNIKTVFMDFSYVFTLFKIKTLFFQLGARAVSNISSVAASNLSKSISFFFVIYWNFQKRTENSLIDVVPILGWFFFSFEINQLVIISLLFVSLIHSLVRSLVDCCHCQIIRTRQSTILIHFDLVCPISSMVNVYFIYNWWCMALNRITIEVDIKIDHHSFIDVTVCSNLQFVIFCNLNVVNRHSLLHFVWRKSIASAFSSVYFRNGLKWFKSGWEMRKKKRFRKTFGCAPITVYRSYVYTTAFDRDLGSGSNF